MKRKLVKSTPDGRLEWEVSQYGNQFFVREVDASGYETESSHTCLDEDAAVARVQQAIEARHQDGFVLSQESLQYDERQREEAEREAQLLVQYDALASSGDLQSALRTHFAPLIQAEPAANGDIQKLIGRAVGIELFGLSFEIRFDNGARLTCTSPQPLDEVVAAIPSLAALLSLHRYMWLYTDDSNDHRLHFGLGASPAEGDDELEGTELDGEQVIWLIEENPFDRFWFYHPGPASESGDPRLCCYEFDGGLHEPIDRTIGALLFARILDLIDS